MLEIMNDPKESQKPQKVIDGMINGRINKELKEMNMRLSDGSDLRKG